MNTHVDEICFEGNESFKESVIKMKEELQIGDEEVKEIQIYK